MIFLKCKIRFIYVGFSCKRKKVGWKNVWKFCHKGGGVGRLMANAILNFHFDFLNTSLILFQSNSNTSFNLSWLCIVAIILPLSLLCAALLFTNFGGRMKWSRAFVLPFLPPICNRKHWNYSRHRNDYHNTSTAAAMKGGWALDLPNFGGRTKAFAPFFLAVFNWT